MIDRLIIDRSITRRVIAPKERVAYFVTIIGNICKEGETSGLKQSLDGL